MKRLILTVFTVCLLAVCLLVLPTKAEAATVDSGSCGDNLTWVLDHTGTLTVSGTGAMTSWASAADVPWAGVAGDIKAVVFADGVTGIGNYAFYGCTGLTSITIPQHIDSIGSNAFGGNANLTMIYFEGDVPANYRGCLNGVTAKAYYPSNDTGWDFNTRMDCGGSVSWLAYYRVVATVGTQEYNYLADALEDCTEGQYPVLQADATVKLTLEKDTYIDLNGYDLSGTVKTGGYKIYGMDSATDKYTCESVGYFSCVDETGAEIVPESHFRSDITGVAKRYMAVKNANGYSFHRFYIGVTHRSLRPSTVSVGYKAVFYGDTMVIANLHTTNAIGYTLQLQGNEPVTVYMSADKIASGKAVTLRLDNYDVATYGETLLYASMTMQLADGTVIQSNPTSMTMRQLVEELNEDYKTLSADQLTAMKAMIEKYPIIKDWKVENLI